MNHSQTAKQLDSQRAEQPNPNGWRCGLVSLSEQGYERFEEADIKVIDWLNTQRTQGIPLGCAASPALAAIYLSPLDNAIRSIPGVKYLRYMDDWVILCPTKWKMRRAVKVMHQTLHSLGLHVHPDKTFIEKVVRGSDFLGAQFSPSPQNQLTLSSVSLSRLNEHLKRNFQPQLGFTSRVNSSH
jgi:hypothetical protein